MRSATQPQLSEGPVKTVPGLDALRAIGTDGVGGVIWQRRIPKEFHDWIDGLAPQNLPALRAIVPPAETRALLTEVCEAAGTPAGPNRDWLINDACALADAFVRIMKAPYLQLRLDVVSDNACRKFHVDMVRARLICTYRGRGTQYGVLQNGDEPEDIFSVPTGDPILLRGMRWPDRQPGTLRHRSPPIAGTGETRLIFVLDAVENLDRQSQPQMVEPKRRIPENKQINLAKGKIPCA